MEASISFSVSIGGISQFGQLKGGSICICPGFRRFSPLWTMRAWWNQEDHTLLDQEAEGRIQEIITASMFSMSHSQWPTSSKPPEYLPPIVPPDGDKADRQPVKTFQFQTITRFREQGDVIRLLNSVAVIGDKNPMQTWSNTQIQTDMDMTIYAMHTYTAICV